MKKIVLLALILGIAACSNAPQPPSYKSAPRVPVNVVSPSTSAEADEEASADIDVMPD